MSRMSKRGRAYWYPKIVKRSGEACCRCRRDRDALARAGLSPTFCIDHLDNNNANNKLANLQLLCHPCNTAKNHPATRDADPTSSEMARSMATEPAYRKWVFGMFLQAGADASFPATIVVDGGAEKFACSPVTVKRYLRKMTSIYGLYLWDENGRLRLKPDSEWQS